MRHGRGAQAGDAGQGKRGWRVWRAAAGMEGSDLYLRLRQARFFTDIRGGARRGNGGSKKGEWRDRDLEWSGGGR